MENLKGGALIANDEIIFAQSVQRLRVPLCDRTVITELSEDFTLPDYLPEIRRLLRITPCLPEPACYVGRELAEFSGNVLYTVTYAGGDGLPTSTVLSCPYEASSQLDGELSCDPEGEFSASDDITTESVTGRVNAPRRLNIRCRLKHRIRAFGERQTAMKIFGDPPVGSVMRLTESHPAMICVRACDDSSELEEIIPSVTGRVAASDASLFFGECGLRDDGFYARGTVCLRLAVEDGEGALSVIERKIPCDAAIPADIDGDGWSCCVSGCVSELSAAVTDSGISCRMRLSLCGEARKNQPVSLTADVYSTCRECELDTVSLPIISSVCCTNGNFTLDGSSELEGLPENAAVIFASASAEPEALEYERGKLMLTGKCRISVLIGGEEYLNRDFDLPFRYETSGSAAPDDWSAKISCCDVRVKLDGSTASATAELSVALCATVRDNVTALNEASFGADRTVDRAAYTIAYINGGETLWSLAKRYSVDPSAIAAANGIKAQNPGAPDSLGGAAFVII